LKKINKSKIILGTANLASYYGICKTKILKEENAKKIFKFLRCKNIKFIDTAYEYKNNNKIFGKINLKLFKIIIKINFNKKNFSKEKIFKKIKFTLKKYNLKKFYCIMLHNTKVLNKKNKLIIFEILNSLKKKKLTSKIGYSIYNKYELDKFYYSNKPDIIQGPLNIFNQELLKSGWLKKFKKDKVEFHARSIFLQGILLKEKNELPLYFKKYNNYFTKYYNFVKKNKLSKLSLCLDFVNNLNYVSKIIIGIDSIKNLKEILSLKFQNKLSIKKLSLLNVNNKKIIDPRLWKK
jgi:aryl-alcohol dehydrogenase-like predicted oxidoreductase